MKPLNIIIMGPQGSGKGTQAELISKHYGIPHISTGEIFRDMAAKDDALGRKIKSVIDAGELLSDEILIPAVKKVLENLNHGFILDGTPRNLQQAKLLDLKADFVIYLDIPDKIVMDRLTSRLQCTKCRAAYGKELPPKKLLVCDECGGELHKRDDDVPESIRRRLEIFHTDTEPVVKYYLQKNILHKINANGTPEEVFSRIKKVLK